MLENILTFDLGLTTGYAIAYRGKIYSGCFKLQTEDLTNFKRFKTFLHKIFMGFKDIDLVIYEMNFPSRKIRWQINSYGSLRYILLEIGAEYNKKVISVNPSIIKKSVSGKGNATKQEVVNAVKQYTGITPKTYHEADALAVLLFRFKNGVKSK